MSLKADMIKAIQEVADANPDPNYKVGFGTPGGYVKTSLGETEATGQAWKEPGTWPIAIEGIAGATEKASAPKLAEVDDNYILNIEANVILVQQSGTPPAIVITAPTASEGLIGEYIIKGKSNLNATVFGTIDGSVKSIPLTPWLCVRLFCTGSEWLQC
jgi:hypothetical protein